MLNNLLCYFKKSEPPKTVFVKKTLEENKNTNPNKQYHDVFFHKKDNKNKNDGINKNAVRNYGAGNNFSDSKQY